MKNRIEYRFGQNLGFKRIAKPAQSEATEARAESETEERAAIEGYAAVFDSPADIGGYFTEVIKRGAFKRAIQEAQDVIGVINHDEDRLIARTKAGTLVLQEDEVGLHMVMYPVDTTAGRDAVENVRAGNIDQMSFAFIARSQSWEHDEAGNVTRTITDLDLRDVSLVTFPAYEATSAKIRESARAVKAENCKRGKQIDPEPEPAPEETKPEEQVVSYDNKKRELELLELES